MPQWQKIFLWQRCQIWQQWQPFSRHFLIRRAPPQTGNMPTAEEIRQLTIDRIKKGHMANVGRLILFTFPKPSDVEGCFYHVDAKRVKTPGSVVSALKKLTVDERTTLMKFTSMNVNYGGYKEWRGCIFARVEAGKQKTLFLKFMSVYKKIILQASPSTSATR